MTKSNKVFIAVCIAAVLVILASVITLGIFCNYAGGVDNTQVQVKIDGELYNRTEIKDNTSYEIQVEVKNGVEYFLYVDSQYGYISDNKVLHINAGLRDMTVVPLRVVLVKKNYALSEYVCNLQITKEVLTKGLN